MDTSEFGISAASPNGASALTSRRTLLVGGIALFAGSPVRAETQPMVRRLSSALDHIVAPGVMIEVIATGIEWAEGPVWVPEGDYLLFSDPPANVMRRWRRGAPIDIFLSPSGTAHYDPALVREPGSNGLALSHTGKLLIANSGGRSIDQLDLTTRQRTTLVSHYRGKRFNSPNDLHVASDGAIYFTDPPYGLREGDNSSLKELLFNGVYRWTPGGEVVLIDSGLTRPNGIALSPGERQLYVSVSDPQAPRILVYDLDSRGLPIASPKVLLDAKPMMRDGAAGSPDGMKVASDGVMFCAAPGGMLIMTQEAEPLGLIVSDGPIANCAIGEDGRALFMTNDHRVLRMPLARPLTLAVR